MFKMRLKFSLIMVVAIAIMPAISCASWVVGLQDDFATGISDATYDINYDYEARQAGVNAGNTWEDLAWDTAGGNPSWDYRSQISDAASGNSLMVVTGNGEDAFWRIGQTDLFQSSYYKLSFDVKVKAEPYADRPGWGFVSFNSKTDGSSKESGLLINGNVQIFKNGGIAYNPGVTTPSAANGMHHIEIEVVEGTAIITVNDPENGGWSAGVDVSDVGNGAGGIGNFVVYGQGNSSVALDNFEYSYIPMNLGTGMYSDDFSISEPNSLDQNFELSYRVTSSDNTIAPWKDLNLDTTGVANLAWDARVRINDHKSLCVKTGGGEKGLWIPALTELPQSPKYSFSFDIGSFDTDDAANTNTAWVFVRFASVATDTSMPLGLLVSQSGAVQFFKNGGIVYNPGVTTPAGQDGMHHVEVEVDYNAVMVNVDGGEDNGGWSAGTDISSVSDTDGIGYLTLFGNNGSWLTFDNFVYEYEKVIDFEVMTLADDFEVALSETTNDINYDVDIRQDGINAVNPWDDFKFDTTGATSASWATRSSLKVADDNQTLVIFTGNGETNLWIIGQKDLPQSSEYEVEFDITSHYDAAFASGKFANIWVNGIATDSPVDTSIRFLLHGGQLQIFEADTQVAVVGNADDAEKKTHHIKISVVNGMARIEFDYGKYGINRDWRALGNGAAGIGEIAFSGSANSSYIGVDNFVYRTIQPIVLMETDGITEVDEGLTTDNLVMALRKPLINDLTVNFSDTDLGQQLEFTPNIVNIAVADWDSLSVINVAGKADGITEEDPHYSWVATEIVTTDPNLVDVEIPDVTVEITEISCGAWGYSSADLDENCNVDMADFALLASNWLTDLDSDADTGSSTNGDDFQFAFPYLSESQVFWDDLSDGSSWITGADRGESDSTISGGMWFAIEGPWAKAVRSITPVDLENGDVVVYATMKTLNPNGSTNSQGNLIQLAVGSGSGSVVGDTACEPYNSFARAQWFTHDLGSRGAGNNGDYTEPFWENMASSGSLAAIPSSLWADTDTYVSLAMRLSMVPDASLLPDYEGTLELELLYYDAVDSAWKTMGSADGYDDAGVYKKWYIKDSVIREVGLQTSALGDFASQLSFIGSIAMTQLAVEQPVQGDIVLDGVVGIGDLDVIADEWIKCSMPYQDGCLRY